MIAEKDLKVYHTFNLRRNRIKATHVPTGVFVETEGDGYFQTKREAVRLLEEKLADKNLSSTTK